MAIQPQFVVLLLFVSALVAVVTSRLKLPYSIGLVLAGILMGFLPITPKLLLTKELIFSIFLPPLIFEATFAIEWPALKKDLGVLSLLATIGVVISAAVTTVGMTSLAGWDWFSSLLFGVLIASTDPVAVIATFKEAGVQGRLKLLVDAESLFNDGTAAVAFSVALALATGEHFTPLDIAQGLLVSVFGGILTGALISLFLSFLSGKTKDHLVEIIFSIVAAYGSFLLAEHYHMSGVLACLTAGIIFGNFESLTSKGRDTVEAFWECIAFIANAVIFLLIGIREVHQDFVGVLIPAGLAILLVIVGRAVSIYPLCYLFSRSSLKITMPHQHILFWGGLRGALALALALGLPTDLPHRDSIVAVAFAVVTFSVFVQGLTITPLLNRLGLLKGQVI